MFDSPLNFISFKLLENVEFSTEIMDTFCCRGKNRKENTIEEATSKPSRLAAFKSATKVKLCEFSPVVPGTVLRHNVKENVSEQHCFQHLTVLHQQI